MASIWPNHGFWPKNIDFYPNSIVSFFDHSLKGGKAGATANGGEADKGSGNSGEMVSVEVHSPREETVVPAVGDIVTAKVLSVNQRWVPWVHTMIWFEHIDVLTH